jgi:acetyltransferase
MLYQIHRYPADMIDVVHLSDPEGAPADRVVIRPVLPQDDTLTGAFFQGLSSAARHARFMAPLREVSPGLLEKFTHVDYASHLALVAEVFVDGEERVVAEARYALADDGASAEFAVTVGEEWQGRGLASLLLGKLTCRAAAAGVQTLRGETLATNAAMLHLARKAGFLVRASHDVRGVMLLEKHLKPASGARPCGAETASALAY